MTTPTTDLGTVTVADGAPFFAGTGNKTHYLTRRRVRQKPPFNLVLPYLRYEGLAYAFSPGAGFGSYLWGPSGNTNFPPDFTAVLNSSYEKLKAKLYGTAGLGVDLVEYRQSVSMIVSTVGTLAKAFREVKHFRFGNASDLLRMKFIPKGVSLHKSAANNWLEFHFGWSPLLADIHDSCEVLNNPLNSFTVERGRAREPYVGTYSHDFGSGIGTGTAQGWIYAQQGARVKAVTGAGLHTLDQLGVINPLSLAWEVIPFSFVVDWFVNVGEFLGSLTDFAGITLEDTYRTQGYVIESTGQYAVKPGFGSGAPRVWKVRYVYSERTTSLSGIALNVKRIKTPSVVRAATAVSLLVQQLKR